MSVALLYARPTFPYCCSVCDARTLFCGLTNPSIDPSIDRPTNPPNFKQLSRLVKATPQHKALLGHLMWAASEVARLEGLEEEVGGWVGGWVGPSL